jgi:hypothetical protein
LLVWALDGGLPRRRAERFGGRNRGEWRSRPIADVPLAWEDRLGDGAWGDGAMSLFEFTFALSAVMLGLALTHIAATVHKLLLAGKRVTWAPEPILLTGIVVLVIIALWLFSWSDRNNPSVTAGEIMLHVSTLFALYISAASCLPEPSGNRCINLRTYYEKTRLLSFGALLVSLLLSHAVNIIYREFTVPPSFWPVFQLIYFPALYLSLMFIRRRWFNLLALGGIIVPILALTVEERLAS